MKSKENKRLRVRFPLRASYSRDSLPPVNGAGFLCVCRIRPQFSENRLNLRSCLTSLGITSRNTGLTKKSIENRESGGHVAVGAYLKNYKKLIMADGQWGAIPTLNGIPLNAV